MVFCSIRTVVSRTPPTLLREIVFMMKQNLPENKMKRIILDRYDVDEYTLEKNLIDFYAMLRHFNLCEDVKL
jgi:hypothetical protein